MCILGIAPVARAAAPVIGTSTAGDPMMAGHKYYTHWVNGYYWVAWDNGGVGCSFYSSPDGATWTSQGTIFTTLNPNSFNNEWATRFLGTTVIAAAFNGSNSRVYRSGTLNANGTVSWSAESAVGPTDTAFNALNLLIANGRPIMWRDDVTAGGAGALWRGSAIASPTWTRTASNAPAMSVGPAPNLSDGIFTAGALFQTGGANPDDLIVLRSTTATPYAAGSHQRHTGTNTGSGQLNLACTECHGTLPTNNNHVNGQVHTQLNTGNTKFGSSATYKGFANQSSAAFSYGTCSVYCHSAVQNSTGTALVTPPASAAWGATAPLNCSTNCHGTAGTAQGAMPSLAGQQKTYIVEQIKAFRDGKRPATIMHQLSKGYTDQQIELIADHFSRQKPAR